MKVSNREIGPSDPPYIVAEVGANHGGRLESALSLIEAAKSAGADAVKFQAYEADTITLDCDGVDFLIAGGPWAGERMYDLYRECQTPFAWFPHIAEHAHKVGITWFASVFDRSSVDLLDRLDVAAIKIASFELVDLPLIGYAAGKGRPMILSAGMADDVEIDDAIDAVRLVPNREIAVLHCVSGYPTAPEHMNLSNIQVMQTLLGRAIQVGLSDHTPDGTVPIAATALGATIIEKHLTLPPAWDRRGPDAAFSMEPDGFRRMVQCVRETWSGLRTTTIHDEEKTSRPLRRSLYVVADIKAGELFSAENVRSIRPGFGLPPNDIICVLGRAAVRDIQRGTALRWDMMGD